METARIHPLTLRFTSDRREAAFRADYFRSSLWLMRGALLLGAVQYALFGWLDVAMVPDAAPALHAIRAVVCTFVAGVLALTFTRRFTIRNFQWWLASVPLAAGLGVAAFVAVGQDVNGYYDYYAGQMLILFYVHALLRLRFVWASAVSAVLIGLYVVASATLADTTGILLVNNTFFLLAANFSGMAASYGLEYFARRVFIQAEELRESERRLQREDARKSRELEAARQPPAGLAAGHPPRPPHGGVGRLDAPGRGGRGRLLRLGRGAGRDGHPRHRRRHGARGPGRRPRHGHEVGAGRAARRAGPRRGPPPGHGAPSGAPGRASCSWLSRWPASAARHWRWRGPGCPPPSSTAPPEGPSSPSR
jgi:hypothetical protein